MNLFDPTNSDIKMTIGCSLLAFAIFGLDLITPLGVAGGVPYILVVLIAMWSPVKRMPISAAICGSGLTILGFLFSPSGGELWKVLANRGLAIFAIWSVAILSIRQRTAHEEKEKALGEVKILSGFLPICASCKNIRDDKGYWKQIESYISHHSEAQFSHSICPDCAKKLYPELDLNFESKA